MNLIDAVYAARPDQKIERTYGVPPTDFVVTKKLKIRHTINGIEIHPKWSGIITMDDLLADNWEVCI